MFKFEKRSSLTSFIAMIELTVGGVAEHILFLLTVKGFDILGSSYLALQGLLEFEKCMLYYITLLGCIFCY